VLTMSPVVTVAIRTRPSSATSRGALHRYGGHPRFGRP
jgi:hypothetical protein